MKTVLNFFCTFFSFVYFSAGYADTGSTIPVFADTGSGVYYPVQLKYGPIKNLSANNSEFYVNAAGLGSLSHGQAYGHWFEAFYSVDTRALVRQLNGKILNAGMYVKYIGQNNEAEDREGLFLGYQIEPAYYYVKMMYDQSGSSGGEVPSKNSEIEELAFFIDVQRSDGQVDRLWVKNGDKNFTPSSIFDGHGFYEDSRGCSSVRYVDDTSPIFNQRSAYLSGVRTINQSPTDILVLSSKAVDSVDQRIPASSYQLEDQIYGKQNGWDPRTGTRSLIRVLVRESAFNSPTFDGIGFYWNSISYDIKHQGGGENDFGQHNTGKFIPRDKLFSTGNIVTLKDGTRAVELLFSTFFYYAPGGTWYVGAAHFKPYALFYSGGVEYRNWDPVEKNYFISPGIEFDRSSEILRESNDGVLEKKGILLNRAKYPDCRFGVFGEGAL